jgi:hypothetical protein
MHNRWVWLVVLVAGALGCRSKANEATASSAPPALSAGAPAGLATKTVASAACSSALEYLVPPQKYADGDLIRAIVVDGDQVFYRNMGDVFRVPLAGGAPMRLGKAPGLSLSGTTVLWTSGDKLLTQSSGEPIFMSTPKSGGEWSNFIDLTAAKLGGGRDAATRILQGMGKRAAQATRADFDGQAFYFAEITRGKARYAASSALKSVPFAGGEARTLYQADGEIQEVTKAGDRLAFVLTSPPTAAQIEENEQKRKKQKYVFGVKGETQLMSIPLAGGEAKKLLRIDPFMSGLGLGGVVLGAGGSKVYVSGYRDQDITKPGTLRVDVAGGAVEELDKRVLQGRAFVTGESLVIVASGFVEPGKTDSGQLVLTAPRQGTSLTRTACIADRLTLHASAVSGKFALLSLFSDNTGASIAKIPLP